MKISQIMSKKWGELSGNEKSGLKVLIVLFLGLMIFFSESELVKRFILFSAISKHSQLWV